MKRSTVVLLLILLAVGCTHRPEQVHGEIGQTVEVEGEFKKAFPQGKEQTIEYKLEVAVKEAVLKKEISQGFDKSHPAYADTRFMLLKVSLRNRGKQPFEIESVFDNFTLLYDEDAFVRSWNKAIHARKPIDKTEVLKLSPVVLPKKASEFWVIFMAPEDALDEALYLQYERKISAEQRKLLFRIQIKNSGSCDYERAKYDSLEWG